MVDTARDIVTVKKLAKLRRRIESLRGSPRKARELESVARALGRKLVRPGSEPTWISQEFPELRPVSIPHHSRDVKRFTSESILDHLEANDVLAWERRLSHEAERGTGAREEEETDDGEGERS